MNERARPTAAARVLAPSVVYGPLRHAMSAHPERPQRSVTSDI
jgi:hypothetical protein